MTDRRETVPHDAAGRDAMVTAMCAAVDRGDAEAFGSWFADDAVYRFANADELIGRIAVVAATEGAAGALPWVRHTVDEVAQLGDQLFCRFTIATADRTGAELHLPCVTVIGIDGDAIVDYRVYMDMSPVFSTGFPHQP